MTVLNFPRPIKGVDHLSDETSLKLNTVRSAENVSIDKVGNIERREGYTLRVDLSSCHSLYNSSRGALLVCYKNVINVLNIDTYTLTPIATMNDSSLTSFTEHNNNLYYVNVGSSGMFRSGEDSARSIGLYLPSIEPQFTASPNGTLLPGTYGITYTLVDSSGEESGTGPVSFVELTNGGSIVGMMFTILSGYKWRIYMTTANGDEFYQAAEFDANTVSYTVAVHEQERQPDTYQFKPLPFGLLIRGYGARLFVADKDIVCYSDAFRPHLYNPAKHFFPIVGYPYMMEALDTGLFISDSTGVYFYKGDDASNFEVKDASPERAVFGTSVVISGKFLGERFQLYDRVVVWLSQSGYQVGLPTGEVVALHSDQVKLPNYVQGCSTYFTHEGKKTLVTPVQSNEFNSLNRAIDSSIM
jgi:hypothetical protein